MKQIIINVFIFVLDNIRLMFIISGKQTKSEGRDVVELLHHRVHIAHAAQILNSRKSVEISAVGGWCESRFFRLVNSVNLFEPVILEDFIDNIRHLRILTNGQK